MINSRSDKKEWPCYFSKSTTTGEKDYEEFLWMVRFLILKDMKELVL